MWPQFISHVTLGFDDDQSMQFFADIFVKFIYQISQDHEHLFVAKERFLVETYLGLCGNPDPEVRLNATKNYPCMFMLLTNKNKGENLSLFIKALKTLCVEA